MMGKRRGMKKKAAVQQAVATSAEFAIPIEDMRGLLKRLDDEPPRPQILDLQDELMRIVAESKAEALADRRRSLVAAIG